MRRFGGTSSAMNLRVTLLGEITNVFDEKYASSTLIVDQARPDPAALLPEQQRQKPRTPRSFAGRVGAGRTGQTLRGQTRRSTIIFLISAIALAGLRPLGQVCVQFMMVWQR